MRSAESLGASPIGLYIHVPNVDEAFEQALSAGAAVTMPVEDMFWGDRCGALEDRFGCSWRIATHTHDPTPEQIQEGARSFLGE